MIDHDGWRILSSQDQRSYKGLKVFVLNCSNQIPEGILLYFIDSISYSLPIIFYFSSILELFSNSPHGMDQYSNYQYTALIF